jgi:hypothetical protein
VRATLVAQLLVSLFCAGPLAACTLDVSGLADVGADAVVMADDSGGDALDASPEASPDSGDASSRGDAGDGTIETGTDACGPASLGYACVASAPEGWSQAVYDPTGQASCPKQFPQSIAVDVDTRAPSAQCSCSCTVVTQPTCDKTAVSVVSGATASCTPGSMAVTADGTCVQMPGASAAAYVNLVAPTAMPGTCSSSTVAQLPSSGNSKGQLCSGAAPLAGGCGAGQVCVAAPSPLKSCIEQNGPHSCPPGYSVSHFVGSAHDTRGCGPGCSCTQAATCSAALTYFTDDACRATNVSVTTGVGCSASNASPPPGSYMATVSVQNVACNPVGAPLPVGHAILDQERTICCN